MKHLINEMEETIDSIGDPERKYRSLSKFRDSAGYKTLDDTEHQISTLMIEINSLNKKNKKGQTPKEIAAANKNYNITRYINQSEQRDQR